MVSTAAARLTEVAAVGPYFAVACGKRPDTEGFSPLTELYGDGRALERYAETVARRLGTGELRVAASTVHLQAASRLWSIALASAALTGHVPDLDPAQLWWRQARSGPVELWLPAARELPRNTDTVTALHDTVAVRNLRPLTDAVHGLFGVSRQVLRGNAASALVGALRVLLTCAPHSPHSPVPLVHALLDREPLTGAGTFTAAPDGSIAFRRRSCCLYYRVPGAGTCGDCVLRDRRPHP
ncbi:(2Fe-2S)-binding protein [Streptomyces xantholiticus]|uniref:(2Fe-2S)-binding protein n=1 Tax=Streptomyces xantholiticus TaxID=68285 RepID=UPI00167A9288|nr:(2Fe-2S)-binding protein [Streptomyces xantholiticus]GGW67965.1 hypothetical protein GCM10010381_61080 [Streptomyces xantholiticus]